MDYVGNYYKYNKAGAMVVLLGFISATGMPPAGLFVSEFLIFQSLFQAHNLIILLVVLILLTMIIYGFGSNVFRLLFTPPVEINEKQIPVIKVRESLSQYLLLALTVYFAYCPPSQLVSLIQEAANLIN
jgi:hydrogenase-4 component F